ncbi:MAG: Crp/Fnr family transcriptional regulator [Bacillota bacterium]|nr:MAG: Crp/Fnr family transcriptional regulator [Bacillota bacterium]
MDSGVMVVATALGTFLYQFPLFRPLPRSRLEELGEYAFMRRYQRGQILFMEGDPRDRIYFLTSGYIRLVSTDENCSTQLFLYEKPYSIFPYVGLFKDEYYRFSGETVTDVELIFFPTDVFERLVQDAPPILIHLIRLMGDKLYEREVRCQRLAQAHAADRVRHLIGILIQDLGEPVDDSTIRIPCPLTTSDLARMAGTSRETVSRLIQEYRTAGKLMMKSKTITVTDPAFFSV